jgi:hypothetical protein
MVVGTGEPFVVEDSSRHPVYARKEVTHQVGIGTYIGAPVRFTDHQIVGTLCGIDPDPHAYSPQQVQFLQVLARMLGAALERNLGITPRPTNTTIQSLQTTQAMLRCVQHCTSAHPAGTAAPAPAASGAAQEVVIFNTGARRPLPLAVVLQEAGYRVRLLDEQPTAERVVAVLDETSPLLLALVASDPVEPLLDVIRQVRQRPAYQLLPLFVLTAQRLHAIKAYHAGASQCLYSLTPEACRAELRKLGTLAI